MDSLCATEPDPQATGNAFSIALSMKRPLRAALYTEKDVPQPHERVEFGLMKLNPWRINVSS